MRVAGGPFFAGAAFAGVVFAAVFAGVVFAAVFAGAVFAAVFAGVAFAAVFAGVVFAAVFAGVAVFGAIAGAPLESRTSVGSLVSARADAPAAGTATGAVGISVTGARGAPGTGVGSRFAGTVALVAAGFAVALVAAGFAVALVARGLRGFRGRRRRLRRRVLAHRRRSRQWKALRARCAGRRGRCRLCGCRARRRLAHHRVRARRAGGRAGARGRARRRGRRFGRLLHQLGELLVRRDRRVLVLLPLRDIHRVELDDRGLVLRRLLRHFVTSVTARRFLLDASFSVL